MEFAAILGATLVFWLWFRGSKIRYSLIKAGAFDAADDPDSYANRVKECTYGNKRLWNYYLNEKKDSFLASNRTPFLYKGKMIILS